MLTHNIGSNNRLPDTRPVDVQVCPSSPNTGSNSKAKCQVPAENCKQFAVGDGGVVSSNHCTLVCIGVTDQLNLNSSSMAAGAALCSGYGLTVPVQISALEWAVLLHLPRVCGSTVFESLRVCVAVASMVGLLQPLLPPPNNCMLQIP